MLILYVVALAKRSLVAPTCGHERNPSRRHSNSSHHRCLPSLPSVGITGQSPRGSAAVGPSLLLLGTVRPGSAFRQELGRSFALDRGDTASPRRSDGRDSGLADTNLRAVARRGCGTSPTSGWRQRVQFGVDLRTMVCRCASGGGACGSGSTTGGGAGAASESTPRVILEQNQVSPFVQ